MSSNSFRIISWDVGIIHLAYCVLEIDCLEEKSESKTKSKSKTKPQISIIDWDEINLIEDDRITLKCCGHKVKTKSSTETLCGNNAKFYIQLLDGITMLGYCKTHLAQHKDNFDEEDVKKIFSEVKPNGNICYTCSYKQRTGNVCGKKAKYTTSMDPNSFFCAVHYKSELSKKMKLHSPQPIKNLIVKKYPTAQLQLNLWVKLDSLAEHFAKLDINEVVIENQPSFKNPKMKSIANTLSDWFLARGVIDQVHGLQIDMIKMMAPCNKLKINNDNTIAVFKKNKDNKKKYKLTKDLGIQYTKQLLSNDPAQLEYLDLYKKKDDICDAYLQGRYYLEIYRKKNISNLEKNFKRTNIKRPSKKKSTYTSGSKTTKSKSKTKSVVVTI